MTMFDVRMGALLPSDKIQGFFHTFPNHFSSLGDKSHTR